MSVKTIQIYDRPMCCSTGICGPQVDPVLPRFAADLDWLKTQGHRVERYNLAHQPAAFVENPMVQKLLSSVGTDCLPIITIDGQVVSQNRYPDRATFAEWIPESSLNLSLPLFEDPGACCSGNTCC